MNKNVLLCTDVYKMGHMEQYPSGTTKVYSYLIARSDKKIPYTLFFGLQPILTEYLSQKITHEMVDEFLMYRQMILGNESDVVTKQMRALADLGYIPLSIKAIPEGTVLPVKNVLATITNTHPDFHWCVGFFESLILKVWNTCTVASYSLKLRKLLKQYSDNTCDNDLHLDWQVHDFGYRGVSSEETAALSGAAHLISFRGTDTVPAVKLLKEVYSGTGLIGASVPASEHSVMSSFDREHEIDAFKNMLQLYPSGIVSIVSDTYDLWNVLTNFTAQLKEDILKRDGKVVFRPDSGDPEKIICGDPEAEFGTPSFDGAIRLLDDVFGSTVNEKGYKVLNPKVGLIYGDGMYFERIDRIMYRLAEMGYATSNLVLGVGGLLLQQHSRDDQGFAIKATYCEINGVSKDIVKDPITDSGKKSHKGLMTLVKIDDVFTTIDQVDEVLEQHGLLQEVFRDGKILKMFTLDEVRKNSQV